MAPSSLPNTFRHSFANPRASTIVTSLHTPSILGASVFAFIRAQTGGGEIGGESIHIEGVCLGIDEISHKTV